MNPMQGFARIQDGLSLEIAIEAKLFYIKR